MADEKSTELTVVEDFSSRPLRIFLSHHETEASIALELKSCLEEISDGMVKVYTFKDSDVADFRREIEERATEADILLFFYTAEHRDLSWISLEIGLYRAARRYRNQPPYVFCFMSQDINSLPPIIDDLERTPATADKFTKFMQKLIVDGTYSNGQALHQLAKAPGGARTKEKGISETAEKLSSMFSRRLAAEYYTFRLGFEGIRCYTAEESPVEYENAVLRWNDSIHVRRTLPRRGTDIEAILDFSDVMVNGSDLSRLKAGLPAVERYSSGPLSWFDLAVAERAAKLAGRNHRLRADIMDFCDDDKLSGRSTKVLTPLMVDNDQSCWPVISRIERRDGVPVNVYIIFIDEPTGFMVKPEGGPGPDVSERRRQFFRLVKMLNLARRFRSDILDPTLHGLHLAQKREEGEDALMAIYEQMWSAIEAMSKEAEQYDLSAPTHIPAEFDEEGLLRVYRMYGEFATDVQTLKRCIQAGDHLAAMKILVRWQELNREFMDIGLATYRNAYIRLKTLPEIDADWQCLAAE